MTKKQEIEIEGLPNGWKPIAYRLPLENDKHVLVDGLIFDAHGVAPIRQHLIVEKIQPRRIVLEETGEKIPGTNYAYYFENEGLNINVQSRIPLREIKE